MAESVTLTSAVRESLLSLQNTSKLIEQTQGRLASGLKVESAIDDPVSFFQAKSLSDRAFDFSERKDAIDQGISTVTAALDGVEGIEELVRQLKGPLKTPRRKRQAPHATGRPTGSRKLPRASISRPGRV